jgi:phospholipase C
VHVINFLQQQPEWRDTAVVIAYDDSDGWYDHQAAPRVNASATAEDALDGAGACNAHGTLAGTDSKGKPVQGRCGYGPRLPLLVISPWARTNHVDHTLTDQSSVTRFIEDNWLHGKRIGGGSFDVEAGSLEHMFDFFQPFPDHRKLVLDEQTGLPVQQPSPWPWASAPHGHRG